MADEKDILSLFGVDTEKKKDPVDSFLEKMAENTDTAEVNNQEEDMGGLKEDLNNMSLDEVLQTLNSVRGEKEAEETEEGTEEQEMSEDEAFQVLGNTTASELIYALSEDEDMAKEAEEEFEGVDLNQYSALDFLEALGQTAEGEEDEEEKTAESDDYNEFYNAGRAYAYGLMDAFENTDKTAEEEEPSLEDISAAEFLEMLENEKQAVSYGSLKKMLGSTRALTRKGREKALSKAKSKRFPFLSGEVPTRAQKESVEDIIRQYPKAAAGLGLAGVGAGAGGYAAGKRSEKKAEDLTLDDISGAELLELLENEKSAGKKTQSLRDILKRLMESSKAAPGRSWAGAKGVGRHVGRHPYAYGGGGLGAAGLGGGAAYARGRSKKAEKENLEDLTLDDISGAELLDIINQLEDE